MAAGTELTQKFEEERLRTQEQSQIVHLQGQIDELRRLIRDQNNKYQWSIEQIRKNESAVAQAQTTFEQHTGNVNQIIDRSRRDVLDVRKEVSNALVKIEESFEPIRQIQAQIQQVAETHKQDRDHTLGWLSRIEELEQKITTLQSQITETEDRHRQLAVQLNHLRDADSQTIQEVRRVSEDLQVEKQSLRRQTVEAQQLVVDVRQVQEEQDARINRIDEIRMNVELFAEKVPEQIGEIMERFPPIDAEMKRIERVLTERFLMSQERMEELRRQTEEQLTDIQETEDQHTHQHTSWLERIDNMIIEIDQRVKRDLQQLEDVQRYHIRLLKGLEEREVESLSVVNNIMQRQIDRIKSSQKDLHKPDDEC